MLVGTPSPRSRVVARRSIPYPPSPAWIPADLTNAGRESTRDVAAVMTGLFLFLGLYATVLLVALAGVVAGLVLCVARGGVCLGIPVVLVGGCVAFMLVRVLFYRGPVEKELQVELTEDDQPVLFEFLRTLADEVGAPEPDRVFVTPEVNAAVISEVSLVNLVVPPKRHLKIGLALVNVLTLSEFKAVMGHEFGHFAQETGRIASYIQVAFRVMAALHGGETWVAKEARAVGRGRARGHDNAVVRTLLLAFVGVPVWVTAKAAWLIFYFIEVSRLSLSRNQEFHADRVAVSVAGSNAIVHGLARLGFARESLDETFRVLDVAAQHNVYTRDFYYHHTKSAERLRKVRRNSALGLPPTFKRPEDGRDVRVFDADDDPGEPDRWSTHPRDCDRERNAKRVFVPAAEDTRSPWILFADADDLRERLTAKLYRRIFRIKKSIDLDPPERVQRLIDEEHAEVTFDRKYHGAYDQRWITPGDIAELNALIEREPCARRGRKLEKVRDLEHDLEDLEDWFSGFDRRVYLIFGQMARQAGGRWPQELTDRYLFHLAVQALHVELARVMDRVDDVVAACSHFEDGLLPEDYFDWAMDTLRAARQTLLDCIDRARGLRTPELANIKAGPRLHTLIFDQEVLHDLPRSHIKPAWIIKLGRQMGRMRGRLCRMDFKSLGALLQLQDRLAEEWRAKILPTSAPDTADSPPGLIVVQDAPPTDSAIKPS
jgi:Zn-dependent protease with chaperone function